MSAPQIKVGDRVRTGKRMTNCDAYPYALYIILAGPFENRYDDDSHRWNEYVGAFAEDGFRDSGKATLHTIDASEVHRVCVHDEIEAHDTGLYEPGKPAHHGFASIWCDGPTPVPMVAMTPERIGAIATLLDEEMAEKATTLSPDEWFELLDDSREIIVALLAEARGAA